MKTNNIAIFGAGGHGKVIGDLAECLELRPVFFDDRFPKIKKVEHWSIVGGLKELFSSNLSVVVAIGNNKIRSEIQLQCESEGLDLSSLIHPSAVVSQYTKVGSGSVVFANAVVNCFSNIGKGCIINTASVVEHDSKISSFVHISPNATLAGNVSIGERTSIGMGTAVRQGINIGQDVTVGAGSVVVKDVLNEQTVYGVPAKLIKE